MITFESIKLFFITFISLISGKKRIAEDLKIHNLKELEEKLLEHCYNMDILKRNASQKKKESILDSLVAAIVRSDISQEEVYELIEDINSGEVLDLRLFEIGGNIEDFIKPKWRKIYHPLWRQRSVGLGTPNSASGEGELMFIFLSPSIKKPTKGDLMIGSDNLEIKGEGIRVNGKISGVSFTKKALDICSLYGLVPNVANRTGLPAVELEKLNHLDHWINQLSYLDSSMRDHFINEWFRCIDDLDHFDSVGRVFSKGVFDHDIFVKEIVKILFASMVSDRSFDKFIMLGDGKNIKVVKGDVSDFNVKIDSGEIKVESDYFRINQHANIGWYIS